MRRLSVLLFALSLISINVPVSADLSTSSCEAAAPVLVTRVLGERRVEEAKLQLTDCFGQPRKQALTELSLLARPHGVPRPSRLQHEGALVADSVKRLDARLLTRLQALATRWPGKRIEIVSGYRPNAKGTSRHKHGRALDLRIVGVDKEEVVAFAKTIPGTGVGYYPNSVFTHVDVREEATTWIDHSGPGERARYGKFPEDFEELLEDAEASKRAARSALHALQTGSLGQPGTLAVGQEAAKEASAPTTSDNKAVRASEKPSAIGDGLDTTSAWVAERTQKPARTESKREDAKEDRLNEAPQDVVEDLKPLRIKPNVERSSERLAVGTTPSASPSEPAPPKPIDWSPPW